MCEKLHHSYMHIYTGVFITLVTTARTSRRDELDLNSQYHAKKCLFLYPYHCQGQC